MSSFNVVFGTIYDECEHNTDLQSDVFDNYDSSEAERAVTELDIYEFLDEFPETIDNATLVKEYLESAMTEANLAELEVQVDDSDINRFEIDNDDVLIRAENVLKVSREQPDGLLEFLDVQKISIGDDHDTVLGTFSRSLFSDSATIHYEFSHTDNVNTTRRTGAHEILGHAYHYAYCGKFFNKDSELTAVLPKDFNFTDNYNEIDDELLEYGPTRALPSLYAARNVKEFWSEVAEFTFEVRGLIQPEDLDYGSPLYEAQSIFIERLTNTFGDSFTDFLHNRSTLLRRKPTNEIHLDTLQEWDDMTNVLNNALVSLPALIDPPVAESNSGSEVGILNGAAYHRGQIYVLNTNRAMDLILNPLVFRGSNNQLMLQFAGEGARSNGVIPLSSVSLYLRDINNLLIETLPAAEAVNIPRTVKLKSWEADELYDNELVIVRSQSG